MKKLKVFLVIFVMLLAGCGANNVVENMDAPQGSEKQSEIDTSHEASTDLYQKFVPLSTKTFDGIWKLTTYQDLKSVKKITEWKPKPLNYKGELQKKWHFSVYNITFDNDIHGSIPIKPYRSYPRSWGVFDFFSSLKSEERSPISGFINPENGKFNEQYNSLGLTDGEYFYEDDNYSVNVSECYRLSDMESMWTKRKDKNVIGGVCAYPPPVHMTYGSLIYMNSNCVGGMESVKRVNPITGNPVWLLETIHEDILTIWEGSTTKNYFWIKITNRTGKKEKTTEQSFKESSLMRINPEQGSFEKIIINGFTKESILEGIDDTLWITLEDDTIYTLEDNQTQPSLFEPKKQLKTIHKIKSLTIEGSSNGKILFYVTIEDKNNEHAILLYNPKTGETKELFYQNILSNNGTFYIDEKDRFVGINLETGETTWILPKEKDKNPSICLIDWRGVLVYQENQLVCYAPK
jgi:hypothetical protein